MSKRAVVTGAAKHLGYHVAQAALQDGFEVELLITFRNTNVDRLLGAGAHFTVVDFDDRATFRRHLEWADVLFHVALPEIAANQISHSSERVLNAAVAAGVPRIVYTSSADVFDDNHDPRRLLSERDLLRSAEGLRQPGNSSTGPLCDRLIRDHGVDIRRLYTAWLFGPGDTRGNFPQELVRTFLKRGQNFWFQGGVSINAVEEAGRAHVSAALAEERCGVYVLGGENLSFRQLYSHLAELSDRPTPRFRIPAALLAAGSRANTASDRPSASRLAGVYSWYDSSKAIRELNYKIRPHREVLQAAILMERKRAAGTNALFPRPSTRHLIVRSSEVESDAPIVLTGVPGWIGNRMLDIFLNGDRTGYRYTQRRVHLIMQPHQAPLFDLPEHFRIFTADLTRPSDLSRALAGVRTVFHLQQITHPKRIESFEQVNVQGTKNLADACIRAGVRRFLYVSTDAVCAGNRQRIFDESTQPNPVDEYGLSKWRAEQYLLEKCAAGLLDVTILREFWAFGPFAPAAQERFLASLRRRRQFIFGDGNALRSISHVDNTIGALLAAERSPATIGKTYWIGDEKHDYTVDEIHELLCQALGRPYRPLYLPAQACAGARLADRLLSGLGRLHPSLHAVAISDRDRAGRIEAAQRDFHYRPVITFPEYANELASRGRLHLATRKASAG